MGQALTNATELGCEVCTALHTTNGWPWPAPLAERALLILNGG